MAGDGCQPPLPMLPPCRTQGAHRLGDSLAVELPALTRPALVRIQVPQPKDVLAPDPPRFPPTSSACCGDCPHDRATRSPRQARRRADPGHRRRLSRPPRSRLLVPAPHPAAYRRGARRQRCALAAHDGPGGRPSPSAGMLRGVRPRYGAGHDEEPSTDQGGAQACPGRPVPPRARRGRARSRRSGAGSPPPWAPSPQDYPLYEGLTVEEWHTVPTEPEREAEDWRDAVSLNRTPDVEPLLDAAMRRLEVAKPPAGPRLRQFLRLALMVAADAHALDARREHSD